jgi:photosystem II stability/assembly factor-like uncharacterized protein
MRTKIIFSALVLTLGFFFFSVTNAQWVPTSLDSGVINCLAAKGDTIFAGNYNSGVFLSSNNGNSWDATGYTSAGDLSIAISGNYIFIGTDSNGVILSTNNGLNWTVKKNGLPTDTKITALAISDSNVFAGTWGSGVYLSTDHGSSWAAVNSGLSSTDVFCLAVSGNNILAGTYDGGGTGGIFLSPDNGSSWSAVTNGLLANTSIISLAVRDSNIFAGTDGAGVYLSTNNGQLWTAMNNGFNTTTQVNALAIAGNNIYAGTMNDGVFLSTCNGSNWAVADSGFAGYGIDVNALAVSGSYIYAGTYQGGIWKRPLSELIGITPSSSVICSGICVTLAANGEGTYQWSSPPGETNSSITICPTTTTTYTVTVSNGGCTSSASATINVNPLPPTPVIVQSGNFLISNATSGNQWYNDNGILSGQTAQVLTPVSTSHYYCIVTDTDGCVSDTSNIIYVVFANINNLSGNNSFIDIYPNPSINNITIETTGQASIAILDVQGQIIETLTTVDTKTGLDVSSFPSGIYIVEVKTEKGSAFKRFVKE